MPNWVLRLAGTRTAGQFVGTRAKALRQAQQLADEWKRPVVVSRVDAKRRLKHSADVRPRFANPLPVGKWFQGAVRIVKRGGRKLVEARIRK